MSVTFQEPLVSTVEAYNVATAEGDLRPEYRPLGFLDIAVGRTGMGDTAMIYGIEGWGSDSPIDDYEGLAEFVGFGSQVDRDEAARQYLADGMKVYVVQVIKHGGIAYRMLGEWEPDMHHKRQWDGVPSHLIPVDPEGTDNPEIVATDLCAQMEAWGNGDIFTLVLEKFDSQGQSIEGPTSLSTAYGLDQYRANLAYHASECLTEGE